MSVYPRLPERSLDDAPRLAWIDWCRGAAVLLMVADHVLLASGAPWWLRYGPTRLALPLFGFAAGAAWTYNRCPSWQRIAELGAGSLVVLVSTVAWPTFGWPDPLVVWIIAGLGAPTIVRYPASSFVVSVLLVLYLPEFFPANVYPLPIGVMWAAFGVLALPGGAAVARCIRGRVSLGRAGMEWLGRHALGVYVGHLCAIAVVIGATQ